MALTIDNYIKQLFGKVTAGQVRAQVRRPAVDLSIGRKVENLSRNAKPWAMFDLDETLTYAREAKAQALPAGFRGIGSPSDVTIRSWAPWQRQLKHDVVEPEMAKVFREMKAAGTHNIGILTSRSERTAPVTKRWLRQNNLTPDVLMMRPVSKRFENMGTAAYKNSMLNRYMGTSTVSHFFDDQSSVIKAMSDRGVVAAVQVIPKELSSATISRGGEAVAEVARAGRKTPRLLVDSLDAAKSIIQRVARR
jgi:hypothetical protein